MRRVRSARARERGARGPQARGVCLRVCATAITVSCSHWQVTMSGGKEGKLVQKGKGSSRRTGKRKAAGNGASNGQPTISSFFGGAHPVDGAGTKKSRANPGASGGDRYDARITGHHDGDCVRGGAAGAPALGLQKPTQSDEVVMVDSQLKTSEVFPSAMGLGGSASGGSASAQDAFKVALAASQMGGVSGAASALSAAMGAQYSARQEKMEVDAPESPLSSPDAQVSGNLCCLCCLCLVLLSNVSGDPCAF